MSVLVLSIMDAPVPGHLAPTQQVPELDQAMERCVYGESIAADLLNGTGEIQARAVKASGIV